MWTTFVGNIERIRGEQSEHGNTAFIRHILETNPLKRCGDETEGSDQKADVAQDMCCLFRLIPVILRE